jgi:hypothetical protein
VKVVAPESTRLWFTVTSADGTVPSEVMVLRQAEGFLVTFDPIPIQQRDWKISVRAEGTCPPNVPCEPPSGAAFNVDASDGQVCRVDEEPQL